MKKTLCFVMGIQVLVLFTIVAPVFAQGKYPERPVKILVGFSPGGSMDFAARLVAEKLTKALGQSFYVENRPGANSRIAAELAANAKPDGYTLYLFSHNDTINAALYPNLRYDIFKDFTPVTRVHTTPYLLTVHPSLPVKTVKDLIELAKAKPGQIEYGSAGIGNGSHFATELFLSMASIEMVHVPYKGSGAILADLYSGEVQFVLNSVISLTPGVKQGRIRPIAISTKTRLPLYPDVPTVDESGLPGYVVEGVWSSIAGPGGTPKPIVTLLNREIVKFLKEPDTVKYLEKSGGSPAGCTPEEAGEIIKSEFDRWSNIAKTRGIIVKQ